jgi:predicted nuclease of predicted toxin-antitoxin system
VRILADENFPGDAVIALRGRGHDVAWVRSDAPGSSDIQVIACAQTENRVPVTFDKDFGELAFRSRLPASSGIILFRISTPSPAYVARVAVAALESRADWADHFAVVEDDRIRMTPLPGGDDGSQTLC